MYRESLVIVTMGALAFSHFYDLVLPRHKGNTIFRLHQAFSKKNFRASNCQPEKWPTEHCLFIINAIDGAKRQRAVYFWFIGAKILFIFYLSAQIILKICFIWLFLSRLYLVSIEPYGSFLRIRGTIPLGSAASLVEEGKIAKKQSRAAVMTHPAKFKICDLEAATWQYWSHAFQL